MTEKIFAVVGSFATKPNPDKGIRVYEYEPEHAGFTLVDAVHPDINAGQTCYNEEKDIFYIVHEAKGPVGEICGGGRIYSGKLDHENGSFTLIDDKETHGTLPCYLTLTASGKYAVVAHHGTRNVITKTKQTPDGSFKAYVECDDVVLALVKIREDGTYGEICDYCFHEAERAEDGIMISKIPHLHCVVVSPDGKLFLSCDKGLDVIHGYHVDEECGKIRYLGKTFVEEGVHPRYGKFHPTAPVFYQDCENSLYVHVWNYDSETGALTQVQRVPVIFDEEMAKNFTRESLADMIVTPDGKYLYISVRGLNLVAVFTIDGNGLLTLAQNVNCHGANPRGLQISPDGKCLYVMNRDSNNIVKFRRSVEDGMLWETGEELSCNMPANMKFVVL